MAQEPAWRGALEWFNDVEGAPNRAVMAGFAGDNPIDGFLHGDKSDQITHHLESKILGGYDVHKLSPVALAALDLVTQIAFDPVTYAPGADVVSIGLKLPKLIGAIKVLRGFSHIPGISHLIDRVTPVVDRLASAVNQGHDLRRDMGRTSERTASRQVIREQTLHDQRVSANNELVDHYSKFMNHTGNIPMKVRTQLQRQLWLEGSKEVRNQLVHDGFRPSTEERAAPILNLVRRYDKNYIPEHQLTPPAPPKPGELIRVQHSGPRMESPHNLPKTTRVTTDPLADRVRDRLNSGSRDIRNHAAAKNTLNELGLLGRPVNTPRGLRYTSDTLNERTMQAQERAQAALQSGDSKRLARYVSLIEKQKALAGGDKAVAKNVGNIVLSPEQSMQRAQNALQDSGVLGRSLATTATGSLKSKTARTPLVNALQKAQMTANNSAKLATRADMAAQKTAGAASQYGLNAQKRVEQATDKLKTKQVMDDQRTVSKLLKAREASGGIDNLPKPISNAVADVRDAQAVKGGAEYQGVKQAARGRNIKSILRPGENMADRARTFADRTKKQMYTAAANVDKADTRNDFIDQAKDLSDQLHENANTVHMPESLKQTIYPDEVKVNSPLMQGIAQAGRDAMFITSIPHKLNLGGFAMMNAKGNRIPGSALAEGVGTILKGRKYAKEMKNGTPVGDQVEKELTDVGAPVKYSRDANVRADQAPAYSKVLPKNVSKFLMERSDKSSEALHRFESGLRYAELQKLKKRGVTDPVQQGGELRDMYGNQFQVAPVINKLQNILGAEFPNYRFGAVPRAAAKAITQSQRGVHASADALQDFNYDISEPVLGGDIRPGGNPITNFAEMIDPNTFTDYAGSSASIGPTSELARARGPKGALTLGKQALGTALPAVSNVVDALGAKDHHVLRLILSGVGLGFNKNTKRRQFYPQGYIPGR